MTTKNYTEQLRAEFEAQIELPPLPDWFDGYSDADKHVVQRYARAAIEAALQSQDREDAERYRWLRKHWFTMTSCYDGGRVEFTTGQPRYSSATEANVDEAIDHARRVEGDGE